ncbi:SPOSA6832_00022, partial [Sporobolomyces salmonicolor]
PNNRVKTAKALQSKKSKVAGKQIHPNSRRAKQLQRVELRSKKLEVQRRVFRAAEVERIDRHLYFIHALPDDATSIPLADLHQILHDYINRSESELVQFAADREARSWRKAEGKSKQEIELEKQKDIETNEYKAGFGTFGRRASGVPSAKVGADLEPSSTVLPDLTLAENVVLCRQWVRPAPSKDRKNAKGGDPSFLPRIRLIRIFLDDKNLVKVEHDGARESWGEGEGEVEMADEEMDDE